MSCDYCIGNIPIDFSMAKGLDEMTFKNMSIHCSSLISESAE